MADVLIMNQDNTGDHPFTYKQGMVVDVFPDGQLGPGTDQHPKFWVVRLPGLAVDDLKALLLTMPLGPEVQDPVEGAVRRPAGRRKDKFDRLKLPGGVRNQLDANREITLNVTLQQVANYLTRIQEDAP